MNKKYKKIIILLMISIFFVPSIVLADFESVNIEVTCDGIFTPEALELIRTLLNMIRILAPILLIVLIAVDFASAIMSQDRDMLAKASSKVVKRALAALGIIFTPTLIIALSKISYVDLILGSDPLCSNATGTKAKATVRVAESKKRPEITMQNGIMHGSYGSSFGGGSGYSFGPGNDSKRSVKTVTINGRTYDMYNQGYLEDISYQSGNLAIYGCGPIAFATAVSGFDSSIGAYEAAELVRSRWSLLL